MKANISAKILKLVVVEVLSQCGFDKTSEHALNILTDVLKYYIEALLDRISGTYGSDTLFDAIYSALTLNFYRKGSFEVYELSQFLKAQILLKNYLIDRYDIKCEDSLLHALRILPKNIPIKGITRHYTINTCSEIKNVQQTESMEIDDFMRDFIESSASEASRRVEGCYNIKLLDLLCKPVACNKINDDEYCKIIKHKLGEVKFWMEPECLNNEFGLWESRKVYKG